MRKLKKLAKQAFDSMVGDGWYLLRTSDDEGWCDD